MIKRLWLAIVCAVWAALPLHAQNTEWTAWLYARESGRLAQVNAAGMLLQSFQLPLVLDHDTYSYNVAVSRGGERIAYTVYSSSLASTYLLLYDVPSGSVRATYGAGRIIGDSIDFNGTPNAFNENDTAFAYGYRIEGGAWEIRVIDALSGQNLFTLNAAAVPIPPDPLTIPVVQQYNAADIIFALVSSGEGPPQYPVYVWNTVLGTVRPAVGFSTLSGDIFALTGEALSPLQDERLRSQLANFPIPYQVNSVQIYDPLTGGMFPFFSQADLQINSARFVENGNRVLINAFDVTQTTPTDPRFWALVERDGRLTTTFQALPKDAAGVFGVADGFIFTDDSAGFTRLSAMQTQGDRFELRDVWYGPAEEIYRLMWVSAPAPSAFSAQSAAWAQLAPPVFADSASAAPTSGGVSPLQLPTITPISGVPGTLTIGGQAQIYTTSGDQLNIRSGPGLSFSIITKASAGTNVIILEGPRTADGFTWWRVRLPGGVEGWAVERADSVQTLVP